MVTQSSRRADSGLARPCGAGACGTEGRRRGLVVRFAFACIRVRSPGRGTCTRHRSCPAGAARSSGRSPWRSRREPRTAGALAAQPVPLPSTGAYAMTVGVLTGPAHTDVTLQLHRHGRPRSRDHGQACADHDLHGGRHDRPRDESPRRRDAGRHRERRPRSGRPRAADRRPSADPDRNPAEDICAP